jgi:hypothetical protein
MDNFNVSNILWKHGMIRIELNENKILNKMLNILSTLSFGGEFFNIFLHDSIMQHLFRS